MKKLTALLAALVLALSLVPEAALADDGAAVFINGKQFLTDGVSFYVCESGEIVSELPSGCGSFAAYENASGILILNNYTGGGIMAYGVELKISVDGSNTIGTPNAPVTTGIMTDGEDVILVGSGSLTVYFSENGIVTSEDPRSDILGDAQIGCAQLFLTYDNDDAEGSETAHYIWANDLAVTGGKITATGGLNMDSIAGIYLEGSYSQNKGSEVTVHMPCEKGSSDTAMEVVGSFTMWGGKLTVSSPEHGLAVFDGVKIYDGEITILADKICFGAAGRSFDMEGGTLSLGKHENDQSGSSGLLLSTDLTVSGGTLEITGKSYGINLAVGSSATISGGEVGINVTAEAVRAYYTSDSDFRVTGGEVTLEGGEFAVDMQNGKAVFSGGTTRMISTEGPAIVTWKGIILEDSVKFKNTDHRVIGVIGPTASIIDTGAEGMWSVYDHDLAPDIEPDTAAAAAAKDVTILEAEKPQPDPETKPVNPATGIFENWVVRAIALIMMAVVYASARRNRRA